MSLKLCLYGYNFLNMKFSVKKRGGNFGSSFICYFLNETYSNHFGDYKMVELCHVQI